LDPLPNKRLHRPTWKIRETAPVDLPEGPGLLDSPAASDVRPASPKNTTNPSFVKICTSPNQFALIREYQQHPSSIPDSLVSWRSFIAGHSPIPPKKQREVPDIIYPYPNISSFLFNFTWRRMCGMMSSANRALVMAVLLNLHFKATDLKGVNFPQIEKQLKDDIQSPWGGNGWRRSNVVIEVPTGSKPTAASRCTEANARARAQ